MILKDTQELNIAWGILENLESSWLTFSFVMFREDATVFEDNLFREELLLWITNSRSTQCHIYSQYYFIHLPTNLFKLLFFPFFRVCLVKMEKWDHQDNL